MSKKTKTAVQPLSENTRRAIIITAIIVVAVIVLSVTLALILKPSQNTPADNDSSSSGSSSLTIRNGDFFYTTSDDTAYPKTAQNWDKYGYKAKESSSHDFESITTNENSVMGIVTTAKESTDGSDTWDDVEKDLQAENITATNPGKYSSDLDDDNVYMIATRGDEKTAASILSSSFSVASGKSVKITVRMNLEQLKSGNPVIMIQDSTTSALSKYWYAYDFEVSKDKGEKEENDWVKYEFYIFNRETSTKYIRVSVGLGNVYSGEENFAVTDDQPIKGSGVLFIDGITYEEVTANDYRTTVDAGTKATDTRSPFKIIENEDIEDESTYLDWKQEKDYGSKEAFDNSTDFSKSGEEYFPFTDRDDFFKDEDNPSDKDNPNHNKATGFKIEKLTFNSNNLIAGDNVGFRLDASELTKDVGTNKGINTLYSLWYKDHHHISFWLRVDQKNEVAEANIYVQTWDKEKSDWTDLDSGSWTSIVTSKEIDKDSNCGWQKYDIYLKPSAVQQEVSILVTLGEKEISQEDIDNQLLPNGTLYITTPAYEKISSKDYNNASSGSYSKKLDLIGVSASTSVTNGSFSAADNSVTQPSGWSPAFAGDSMLYRDGKGDEKINGIDRKRTDVEGSGILRGVNGTADGGIGYGDLDDEQGNILQIQNNKSTSFGYYSNDITLSAHNLYVFSVLAKGTNAHFYLMNTETTLERAKRVVGEGKEIGTDQDEKALGQLVSSSELKGEWKRYYIIILTGDESQTVRLALFNGKIDGSEPVSGNVYFDAVQMSSLGSYATAEDTENEDAEKYIVNWSMGSYELNNEAVTVKDFLTKEQVELLVKVGALELDEGEEAAEGTFANLLVGKDNLPNEEVWNAMLTIPEEKEDNDTDDDTTTTTTNTVDWGLLFSVISSVAMVAALLVVIVVKIFKIRKTQKKTA